MLFYKLIPDRLDYSINLFNELAASFYLYLMLLLTDFHGENLLRDNIGLSLLALVSLVVTVNALKTLISSYPLVKLKVFRLLRKLPCMNSNNSSTVAVKPTTTLAFSERISFPADFIDHDQTRNADRSLLELDRIGEKS